MSSLDARCAAAYWYGEGFDEWYDYSADEGDDLG